jgi:hypothetical protein
MIFHPLQNVVLAAACGAFLASGLLLSAQQDNTAQPKKPVPDEKTIRDLIKRLGDDSFQVREKSCQANTSPRRAGPETASPSRQG